MATAPDDRIATLDIIRGVAVMGILTMNIVAFAMPETAYLNPRAYGGDQGADLFVYLFNFVLFDGKMRGLFSFLFGASALLVIERARGASAARVHYARMFWLLVFGLLHLYLLWWGDILHHYALVGLILFLFRDWQPRALITTGIALMVAQSIFMLGLPYSINRAEAAIHAPHPSANARAHHQDYEDSFGIPSPKAIADDLAVHRGDYAGTVAARLVDQAEVPFAELIYVGMETLAFMLFGMALLKNGMLRGEWPVAAYRRWVLIGFGIGIPAYLGLAWYLVAAHFSAFSVALAVIALPTSLRPLMIMGWASLIILATRGGGPMVARIGAAGRMAFTNYLATTILCVALFDGFGAGLYGELSRAQLYAVVPGVWLLILAWSKPWLARFRYGPFEWLWRSLARGKVAPMRKPA